MPDDIYSFIKAEESHFESDEIQVGENWHWNLKKHVQLIFHLKNGVFFTGENNWLRAFKNIMEPIISLANWTEDIEVKDTTFFIEGEDDRALSFLVKKYHDEVYVREHDLDAFYDEITEGDNTYGGVLVQRGVKRPEVLKLKHVAFGDQTDLLGGPIGFKHYFAPEKLRSMSKFGWGDEKNGASISIEDLIVLATDTKDSSGAISQKENKVPGKTIEVYIVRGTLPEHYLLDNEEMDYHCYQLQIVALYTDKDGKKQGVTLYRKKEDEGNIKFFTSQEVEDRALGRGVGEAMLHPQIWTNFLNIHKMNMLEAASKVPLYTDDPSYTQKNKIQDMENLEITTIDDGKVIRQVPTAAPANLQLLEGSINSIFEHAQFAGAAFDTLMGKEESSGTTFRGQERLVQQGRGPHDRRRGKRAKFIEEIYRDWIIPDIIKEIVKGKKFLATLTTEELMWVAEQMSENEAALFSNQKIKDLVFEGNFDGAKKVEEMRPLIKKDLKGKIFKKGNKQLIEIVKGELEDKAIRMGINIANKQKNLGQLSDKLLSIFQFIFANPQGFQQAMQMPALSKAFGDILEYSGLSIGEFSSLLQAPAMEGAIPSPMQPGADGQLMETATPEA
jgi:hypothetical protein